MSTFVWLLLGALLLILVLLVILSVNMPRSTTCPSAATAVARTMTTAEKPAAGNVESATFMYDGNDPAILHKFTNWYLTRMRKTGLLPLQTTGGVRHGERGVNGPGQVLGLTLYRNQQLLVQLWIVRPNIEAANHRHPNVDAYQIYVAGDLYFRQEVNGRMTSITTPELIKAGRQLDGTNTRYLAATHLPPNCLHGLSSGPEGGAFLTIQHWLDGKPPTSIELDWSE